MKTAVNGVKYLGGHPAHPDPMKAVNLIFDDEGITAKVFRPQFEFAWPAVRSVEIEGADDVQKRVTVTRLVAVGIFAFAAKKKAKHAYITVITANGEAIFETSKSTPQDLRAKLQWVQQRVSANP